MALTTSKLKSGNKTNNIITSEVKLYDSLADVQNQGYKVKLTPASPILYAKYGELNDAKASKLRVKVNGVNKALLTEASPTILYLKDLEVSGGIAYTLYSPSQSSFDINTRLKDMGYYWGGYLALKNPKISGAKLSFNVTSTSGNLNVDIGFGNTTIDNPGQGTPKEIYKIGIQYVENKYVEVPLDTSYNYIYFGSSGGRTLATYYDMYKITNLKISI